MYVSLVISEDECPSNAWVVPIGVAVESSKVAWACLNQCQFTPVNLSALAAGLSCRLRRLRRLSGEPFRAENTRVDGVSSVRFNAARISTHLGPTGMRRLLRLLFGSSKWTSKTV